MKCTCDELGVCQQRAECHLPCSGPPESNRFPFAPGVIDTGPEPELRVTWVDYAVALVAAAIGIAVVGFAAGFLSMGSL